MYSERAPAESLRTRLECVWTIDVTHPISQVVRPDGCIDIIYTRGSSVSRLDVVGTMTTSRSHSFDRGTRITGLRFLPGKSPAVPAVDAVVPLRDMLRIGDLQHRLDDGNDPGALLSAWLAKHNGCPEYREPSTAVEQALRFLDAGRNLDEVAAAANLSVRQFRRRCAELTGLSPRHLARILRFRKACQMAGEAPRPNWAGIACNAGYFDQAHLIRDFREFAGATPMAVFSNTPQTPKP
jgi:AraC-like DNA-binding protein